MPKKLLVHLPYESTDSKNQSRKPDDILQQIYDTPQTRSPSKNCNSSFQPIRLRTQTSDQASSQQTEDKTANRLSCNELECLKERFVDFIKLDPVAKNTEKSSDMNTSVDKEECLMGMPTKALPKSKSMQLCPDKPHSDPDYQTFSQYNKPKQRQTNTTKNLHSGSRYLSRLSVVSSEYSSAESSVSSSSSSSSHNRPEPPQRTVSIRNSTCIYSSSSSSSASSTSSSSISPTISVSNEEKIEEPCYGPLPLSAREDTASIRSGSIYSTYRGLGTCQSSFSTSNYPNTSNNNSNIYGVRSSRSVFSIYEEEDDPTKNASTTTLTTSATAKPSHLHASDIQRIESMYRSIGSIVQVASCTCDLFTTTSEQIALLLDDCWHRELSSIVPVWLFDTGLNPKRAKQLRLLFVDKYTAFPIGATTQATSPILKALSRPILIKENNLPKNPGNDKRMTFTLNNVVCLVQFSDFVSCQEFYRLILDLTNNQKHSNLFLANEQPTPKTEKFSFTRSYKSQSQSLLSLTKLNSIPKLSNKNSKRHSMAMNTGVGYSTPGLKSSQTLDDLKMCVAATGPLRVTGITKSCISNPCAFQHINSIKDGDQGAKAFVDYK